MSRKPSKLILASLFLATLVVLWAITAYPAENATITGDGVRVRNAPSTLAEIVSHNDKGTRVEVVAKTYFFDTIEGRTAPWYKLYDGRFEYLPFYVFGGFVTLDAGVEVPTVSLKSGDNDLMTAFIVEGLYAFGKSKSGVKKKLGKPISEIKKQSTCEDAKEGDFFYTLVYDGVVFRGWEFTGDDFIHSVTYTTDAYDFGGVRVGCSVADTQRVLGVEGRYPLDPAHILYTGQMYYQLDLKTDKERITEITFSYGEYTCGGW